MRIEERTEELKILHAQVFRSKVEAAPKNGSGPHPTAAADEAAIIEKVCGNADYAALWRGDWQRAYPSQSEADLALCGRIAFYAGPNPALISSLFRQSGLYREKWDDSHHGRAGSTYGADTIAKALEGKTEFYQWHRSGGPEERVHWARNGSAPDHDGEPEADCRTAAAGSESDIHSTDTGNALRLAALHGERLRYSHSLGWLFYDEKRWRRDDRQAVVLCAKHTVRSIYREAAEAEDRRERLRLADWAKSSESAAKIAAMIKLAESELPIDTAEMDADRWLLNCPNATVDLRTGRPRPHRSEDLITRLAGAPYEPDAACPLWLDFLTAIMGGKRELVDYLQRAFGYSLTGDVSEQVLFFLYGLGANGKSTLLRVLLALMGEYGGQAAPGLLLSRKGEHHPTEIADLFGRRVVVSVEVGEGKRLAEELLKQLTGGDPMKGRFMHKDFFQFDPLYKLWLAANHKPVIRGTDHAIWRRIPLIPFAVTFTDDPEDGNPDKDPHLLPKLLEELPGILAWAVRGCLEWQRQGLNPPAEIVEATRSYRREMDTLADFLEDCCIVSQSMWAATTDLYEAYRKWAEQSGETPISKKAFGQRLAERGFQSDRSSTIRRWMGVGIREGV